MLLLAVSSISTRWPWLLLGAGVLVLSIALLILLRTRWGHVQPLSKCVVLSVWAHLILLGFASLTNWWSEPVPKKTRAPIRVAWVDEPTDESDEEEEERTGPNEAAQESANAPNADLPPVPDLLDAGSRDEESADHMVTQEVTPSEPPQDPEPSLAEESESRVDERASELEPLAAESSEPPALLPVDTGRSSQAVMPPASELPDDKELSSDVEEDAAELLRATASGETIASGQADPGRDTEESDSSHQSPRKEPAPAVVQLRSDRSREPLAGSRVNPRPLLYQGRSPDQRRRIALAAGGSPETEQAVQNGLDWLAAAQDRRTGRWATDQWGGGREIRDFPDTAGRVNADTALTGLALLCFLGAGHTHDEGPYRETVQHGLDYLLSQQTRESGSLAGPAGRYVAMYCHGIATFALSEALVMSHDEGLRTPVRRAIEFTIRSQHAQSGGWRYERGDVGDTSQFGWQVMSLVSARAAGIDAPPETWQRADRWLQRVALGSHGGLACYVPDQRRASPSMTAEAAACRIFLHGSMPPDSWQEAAQSIHAHGPTWQGKLDLYYCYYATLAMYLAQDPRWPDWNDRLTRELLGRQQKNGPLNGSWDANTRWGAVGGRVYTTAMACLCLETYYRYLPVYQVANQNQSPHSGWTTPRSR